MVVIGFNYPFPFIHDSSAAVILDGKLVFATEEERHTRHKHSVGEPPTKSILSALRYLKNVGIQPEEVSAFAINWDSRFASKSMKQALLSNNYFEKNDQVFHVFPDSRNDSVHFWTTKELFSNFVRSYLERIYKQINSTFPSIAKIVPVRHHLSHAASAYYFSGFSSAVALVMDGIGEQEATTIWNVNQGEFELVNSINANQGSIGLFYERLSSCLGFNHTEGPGKVMGLAPYGEFDSEINLRFDKVAKIVDENSDCPFVFSHEFTTSSTDFESISTLHNNMALFITRGMNLDWEPKIEISSHIANIAWHVQDFTEKIVEATASWAKNRTQSPKIVLAGGVSLNAKANMKLHSSRMFHDMFVFPAANDAGGPVGAAAYVYEHVLGGKMLQNKIEDVNLGPMYNEETVENAIKHSKFKAEYIGDDLTPLAELVSKGGKLGLHNGRSELGPRALGGRSLVANPIRRETWKEVNSLKGREFWRPLSPSILAEEKNLYLESPVDNEFMTLMFRMTQYGRDKAPSVCHVDGTTRPQIVFPRAKHWHNLIRSFKDIQGEGLLLNTSFNIAGEPITETPEDSIRCFGSGTLDALYIDGWILSR